MGEERGEGQLIDLRAHVQVEIEPGVLVGVIVLAPAVVAVERIVATEGWGGRPIVPSECDDVIRGAAVSINKSSRLPPRENTDGVLRPPLPPPRGKAEYPIRVLE